MDDGTDRWEGRPRLAAALRAVVFLLPVVAAVAAGRAVAELLSPVDGLLDRLVLVVAVLATATATLVLTDRVARRLLPLSTLLDLTLLFPDRAPSRMRVARDAVRRRSVEDHVRRLHGAGQDPQAVAREILVLVAALDHHDRPTRGHAERVRLLTEMVARELGVPQAGRDRLMWASLLHDIGKLTIASGLLNKPAKPTATEWDELRRHPVAGADLASPLLGWLGEWGDVIIEHHEMYDGSGYPSGIRGEQISYGARIVAVADAFDVMTAARAYRRPVSRGAARRELVRCSGTQFDPAVVRAMISVSAPRLRRAQGVVAWLSEVPVLATQTVPAATLVQAIGTAALVAGGPVAAQAVQGVGGVDETTVAQEAAASPGPVGQPASAGRREVDVQLGATAPEPVEVPASQPRGADLVPVGDPAGGTVGVPVVDGATGTAPGTVTTTPGAGATTPTVGGAVGGAVGSVGSGAGGLVTGVTGAVGGAVGGPVGTVVDGTGQAVADVVDGVVAPVTGTTGEVLDGVTGAVGGLLGGGSSPAPDPSPAPSTGVGGAVGGIVGGLLGR